MQSRSRLVHLSCLALAAGLLITLTASSAAAKRPPAGGGGGGSTTSTYVKNYSNVLNGVEYGLTPEDVQATPDGGWAGLATTQSTSGVGVSWLVKANSVGATQWQEEIGCLSTPPGDYSDAVSLQQTPDGGYVLAGGTIGCGSGTTCPSTSGLQCGLVEKVDGTGALAWARTYLDGADGTGLEQIKPTTDGGFVAVGTATDANQATGALIIKLDSRGNVLWQRELGPTGSSQARFHAVQQTSDGGFVAAGETSDGTTSANGIPLMSVLVAKFDAAGAVTWQHVYNDVSSGTVAATELAQSIVQTSDGGYAIGGAWNSTTSPGTCCQGALLLKLSSDGALQWQQAYSGGVYCFFNGFNETCRAVGGVVYSVHQAADGGFILAGDSNLELADSTPLVPWLAKVDGSGALVWQENDYQSNPATTRPLSEYFAGAALTPEGPLALGFTENPTSGTGELLGVQTDPNGAVASCAQIHPASILTATNPGLTSVASSLSSPALTSSQSSAPVQTQATSATTTASQC